MIEKCLWLYWECFYQFKECWRERERERESSINWIKHFFPNFFSCQDKNWFSFFRFFAFNGGMFSKIFFRCIIESTQSDGEVETWLFNFLLSKLFFSNRSFFNLYMNWLSSFENVEFKWFKRFRATSNELKDTLKLTLLSRSWFFTHPQSYSLTIRFDFKHLKGTEAILLLTFKKNIQQLLFSIFN